MVLVSEGVLAPGSAISTDKSVLAPAADILGYHVDCTAATIRPRDRAIDKLFFVLFIFDNAEPQPLVLWQCIASLVNMYSHHVIRGMRPFVAALIHMTYRASGHHNQRTTATSSAAFALEMWRAAIILLVRGKSNMSICLAEYFSAVVRLALSFMESDFGCEPMAVGSWLIRFSDRALTLLDYSFVTIFYYERSSFSNSAGIPWSFIIPPSHQRSSRAPIFSTTGHSFISVGKTLGPLHG